MFWAQLSNYYCKNLFYEQFYKNLDFKCALDINKILEYPFGHLLTFLLLQTFKLKILPTPFVDFITATTCLPSTLVGNNNVPPWKNVESLYGNIPYTIVSQVITKDLQTYRELSKLVESGQKWSKLVESGETGQNW